MSLSGLSDRRAIVPVLALIITLAGFGLRLHHLAGDSFWYDEILTYKTAAGSVERAFSVRSHPPLYYLLVSASMKLFGNGEFGARLPSAIAGTVAIPLLLAWGRQLRRPAAGLWAALLLALSPFHLRYSQEARHYALLMLCSLASYYVLYRAIRSKQWRWWITYGMVIVLSILIHYGSLVVLATQTIFLAGWIIRQWLDGERRAFLYPAGSAAIVAGLLAFWLPRIRFALNWNLGETAIRGNQNINPAGTWLRELFTTFGTSSPWLSAGLTALFAAGLLIWIRRREWRLLAFIGGAVFLPVLLIALFKVSRWAFAKYVIYTLPPFLLIIGVARAAFLTPRTSWTMRSRRLAQAGGVLVLLLVVAGSRPLLTAEFAYMERDWRGLADALQDMAAEGDIVLTAAADLPDGFNQGAFVLPYYLEQSGQQLHILAAPDLDTETLSELLATDARIWTAVINRAIDPTAVNNTWSARQFQGSLYLLQKPPVDGPAAAQLADLYHHLLPAVVAPSPRCLLQENLALVQAKTGDFIAAKDNYQEAKAACPRRVDGRYPPDFDLVREFYSGLITQYRQQGQINLAREAAAQLLLLDSKNESALETLTVFNLQHLFNTGQAMVSSMADGVEPVQVLRFTMPQNGDWGDALLVHPPQALSFAMQLPPEPVILQTRIALAPQSWEWGGDGAAFSVIVETVPGDTEILFSQELQNNEPDRTWHDLSLSLAAYAGEPITLTLQTGPGPAADFTADWAGWETPRIMFDPELPDLP